MRGESNVFCSRILNILLTVKESLFNNIKGCQDGYETVASDIVNEISDFRNAYLKLIGTNLGSTEEEVKEAKEALLKKELIRVKEIRYGHLL